MKNKVHNLIIKSKIEKCQCKHLNFIKIKKDKILLTTEGIEKVHLIMVKEINKDQELDKISKRIIGMQEIPTNNIFSKCMPCITVK